MTPVDIIEDVLRTAEGDRHAIARQIAAALDGHHMLAVGTTSRRPAKRSSEITYCTEHRTVKMPCRMPHATADTGDDQEGESQ